MNVYLIGFMGSGKSSLGKKLANRLDRDFIDLDQFIERKEGSSISELFQKHGEDHFRSLEKNELLTIRPDLDAVVSLGGGSCCNKEAMSYILKTGLVIYLKERQEVLYGRLKTMQANRPLIADLNAAELKSFIEEKLEERQFYYEQAHFNYEKDKTSFSFLVNHVVDYIK